eukprot:scaffold1501_cov158-Amphora_coffeaeformis.AAC.7
MQSSSCSSPVSVVTSSDLLEKIHSRDDNVMDNKLNDLKVPQWGQSHKVSSTKTRSISKRSHYKSKSSSSSSPTSPSVKSTKSSPPCKQVRFQTDKNGNVAATYHASTYSSFDGHDEPRPEDIWWTEEEIAVIHCSVFDVCDFFVRFRQDRVATIIALVAACAKPQASREILSQHHGVAHLSSCRGLESAVAGVLQHRQGRTIAQVLHHQERLRRTCINIEDRTYLLAVKYRQSTAYASLWAQILADGDVHVQEKEDDDSL